MTVSMLGWVATAIFAASYFYREASKLKKIQAAAACLWILYGMAIGAVPVIVANLIVAGAALYSALRPASQESKRPTIESANPAMAAASTSMIVDIRPDSA
jgi:hypothetical protein